MTFFHVPWTTRDQTGIARRFSAFLHALHRLGAEITLLHIVPEGMIEAAGPLDALSCSQSAFWGVPLRIVLEPRRSRAKTAWNHYGAGVLDPAAQTMWFPYGGAKLAEAVGRHLDEAPDLVFAHRLPAMLPILRSGRRPQRVLLDIDDIEHKVQFRHALSKPFYPGKLLHMLQLPALLRLERRAVAASRLAFVCSETDRQHLRRLGFRRDVEVVPNALPVPPKPPDVVSAPTVLMLGDMQNTPNSLGAERMAREIWPLVRAQAPDARLLVAGRGSDQLPAAGAGIAGAEFLGFVRDLDTLYAQSRVVCCPVVTGGGTRLKLVEAASYARPIVSTRLGAEGLGFVDGQEALLRDGNAEFAAGCASLLRDDGLCRQLGQAARAVMTARFDVRQAEAKIADMIRASA